ncbi:tetratricopeptide repeat protein, partial [Candidatus Poribacteria bacterium]|nr:tetratricopeptide repeat protein [Candidatus Poribacteria bacterium]
ANLYLTIEGKPREYLGLYVVVEQVDSVFLQDRFGNSDGLLIKGEILNDLEYRGDNWEKYAHDYELKSNEKTSDPTNARLYVEKGNIIGELTEMSGLMERITYVRGMTEAYEKALVLDPENAGGHFGRGMVRFFSPPGFGGDLDGAISDLEFVISKDRDNTQAHFFLGLAYSRQNRKDKAIAHFEKVLELDPQNQAARQQLEKLK